MTKKKKRPWFQLHLSTCIVLMVVAGVLLWLNLRPPRIIRIILSNDKEIAIKYIAFEYSGWPFHRSKEFGKLSGPVGDDFERIEQIDRIFPNLIQSLVGGSAGNASRYGGWGFVAANGAFAAFALAAIALVLERRIRSRAGK